MKKFISFFVGLLLLIQSFFVIKTIPSLIFKDQSVKVNYVIDGDTIVIDGGKKVRYIGIDTPEVIYKTPQIDPLFECFAKEAKEANERLVLGKTVRLVRDITDTDKYGRLLRYVYVNDVFVNDYLVRNGYAKAMMIRPDISHFLLFKNSQQEAEKNKLGVWEKCHSKN